MNAVQVISLATHWLTLWVGLYLLARRPRSAATALAGATFVVLSTYYVCSFFMAEPLLPAQLTAWGKGLGVWVIFAPPLLLHACLSLTGTRLPFGRCLLAGAYGLAIAAFMLAFGDTLIWQYAKWPVHLGEVGPLYPLMAVQFQLTLLGCLAVLVGARARPSSGQGPLRRSLNALIAGAALLELGAALLHINVYLGSLTTEALIYPAMLLGAALVATGVAHYPGLLEGQLLHRDLRASFVGALLLMASYTALMIAVDAPPRLLAETGWFVLALFVLSNELRELADRAVFAPGVRAARAGLRAAAAYAGADRRLDVSLLSVGHLAGLSGFLETFDRAASTQVQLQRLDELKLQLLSGEQQAEIRRLLGLPEDWQPANGIDPPGIYRHLAERLEPRERQALGLRYLGYSDKEMADLMGVRAGVPRSYLAAGKRKLGGLPTGPALLLCLRFSGFVEHDALPLLLGGKEESVSAERLRAPQTKPAGAEEPAE